MAEPLEFRFRSRVLEWCRYYPDTSELEVCFVRGSIRRYVGVPRHAADGLVIAASPVSYFRRHIACRYGAAEPVNLAPPPAGTESLLQRSMGAVTAHLPAIWVAPVRVILSSMPILVRVVRRRKTRHGDHRVIVSRGVSVITVNASGNQWQFTVTLLHEVAHAQVARQSAKKTSPHGVEWKHAFRQLLCSHLHLFPEDLAPCVSDYSRNPLYTTDAHTGLAAALRKHDTMDLRPTVQELAPGQMFSLNGRTVMTKGDLLRRWYRCKSADGRKFRVAPTARVSILYNSPTTA
jgi:SprT protein